MTGAIGEPGQLPKSRAASPVWPLALILAAWQLASTYLCFAEFMFAPNREPSALSLVTALVTATGWVALSLWAGIRRQKWFLGFAVGFWLLVVAVQLSPEWWIKAVGESGLSIFVALAVYVVSGAPLHGLASFVPLDEQIWRTLTVAGGLFLTSAVTFFLGYLLPSRYRT